MHHHITRTAWFALGFVSLIIGIIGAFLPLLPTVPLMLLAAFCFGKSSRKFERWLLDHPTFGPPIHDWRANGAISKKGKAWGVGTLLAAFLIALAWGLPWTALAAQAVVLVCVSVFLLTRPSA